jgi:hypothetical protein
VENMAKYGPGQLMPRPEKLQLIFPFKKTGAKNVCVYTTPSIIRSIFYPPYQKNHLTQNALNINNFFIVRILV